MKQLMDRSPRSLLLATALTLVLTPSVSHAQARVDCSRRISPGVGFSAGRSLTPYMEMAQGVVDGGPGGSVAPDGGLYLAGRLDLPIAGPWRGRVEVSGANWPLELRRYGNDGEVIATDTVGQIGARRDRGLDRATGRARFFLRLRARGWWPLLTRHTGNAHSPSGYGTDGRHRDADHQPRRTAAGRADSHDQRRCRASGRGHRSAGRQYLTRMVASVLSIRATCDSQRLPNAEWFVFCRPMTRRGTFSSLFLLAACGLIASAGGCDRPQLTTIVHGGNGPPTLVLLHGYGSSAEQWGFDENSRPRASP